MWLTCVVTIKFIAYLYLVTYRTKTDIITILIIVCSPTLQYNTHFV